MLLPGKFNFSISFNPVFQRMTWKDILVSHNYSKICMQIIQHALFLLLNSNYLYASPMMCRSCTQDLWTPEWTVWNENKRKGSSEMLNWGSYVIGLLPLGSLKPLQGFRNPKKWSWSWLYWITPWWYLSFQCLLEKPRSAVLKAQD